MVTKASRSTVPPRLPPRPHLDPPQHTARSVRHRDEVIALIRSQPALAALDRADLSSVLLGVHPTLLRWALREISREATITPPPPSTAARESQI